MQSGQLRGVDARRGEGGRKGVRERGVGLVRSGAESEGGVEGEVRVWRVGRSARGRRVGRVGRRVGGLCYAPGERGLGMGRVGVVGWRTDGAATRGGGGVPRRARARGLLAQACGEAGGRRVCGV